MRMRTGLCLLTCCAALTACAAGPHKGPDTTMTTPAVGRPPAPQSAQAALSSEAFTAYADLGTVSNDGLAPADTYTALFTACMNDAGYGQYATPTTTYPASSAADGSLVGPASAAGPWGYIGTAEAAQHGFKLGGVGTPGQPPAGLPAGPQAALGRCSNILMHFNNTQNVTSLAGIATMSNAISSGVLDDPSFKNATKAWSACMATNGYITPDATTLMVQESLALAGPGSGPAQNQAQTAEAVADAHCTQTTDLAGIYFAVQASYEQQTVSTNQQALNAAVRQYKASYTKELNKLPALLRTTPAAPATGGPGGSTHVHG
jgi:hypothetical protein